VSKRQVAEGVTALGRETSVRLGQTANVLLAGGSVNRWATPLSFASDFELLAWIASPCSKFYPLIQPFAGALGLVLIVSGIQRGTKK